MSTFRSIDDAVKIFGMTNRLLESDLDRVEKEFSVDLGRTSKGYEDRDEKYYPQFEESIRQEAAKMGSHYEIFYCLEKSIRGLIADTLKAEAGPNWWDSGKIPANIHSDVGVRIQRDVDSGVTMRSTESIDFTNFGELAEIIKFNWDIFGGILSSKKAVEKVLSNLNTLRGPIAHCSVLAEDEVLRLQLGMRDWFRLME